MKLYDVEYIKNVWNNYNVPLIECRTIILTVKILRLSSSNNRKFNNHITFFASCEVISSRNHDKVYIVSVV